MANPLGGKTLKAAITNGFPIGAVIECAVTPADGTWLPVSGQSLNRSDYPLLAERYPLGSTTFTIRTCNSTSSASPIISASPTYFVIGANNGTAPIQYSVDGVTWLTTSVIMTSSTVDCVIWAGSRFIGVYNTATAPNVTTGDNPGSTWTATTGASIVAAVTNNYSSLAYSPQLGMTAFIPNGASTSIYTLLDGSTAWVNQTATSATRSGICWTGTKFITITGTGLISSSSNGVTWSDSILPNHTILSNPSIASNNKGTVVIYANSIGYKGYEITLVSNNHGVDWRIIKIPSNVSQPQGITFSGDKFFLIYQYLSSNISQLIWSNDGENWTIDSSFVQSGIGTPIVCIALKGSTIAGWSSSTTAFTGTINNSKFTLPSLMTAPNTSASGAIMPCQYYIKAR